MKELTPEEKAAFIIAEAITNAELSRSTFIQTLMDPRRDVYKDCGLPAYREENKQELYQVLYDREAVATRVVEVLPKETWQTQPTVFEDKNPEIVTEFEKSWDVVGKNLLGEESFYQDEEGSSIWDVLIRADTLSGIGSYGAILFGIADGKELSEPADLKAGEQRSELLYMRPFPESQLKVAEVERDKQSPRYGHPLSYNITFSKPDDQQSTTSGIDLSQVKIHWTRVVHIADNLGSSPIFGAPRMQAVLNNLLGLQKLYCASPEMYWKGAFFGLSFETHPQLGGDVKLDEQRFKDKMEVYQNHLQRYIQTAGMTVKTLAPQVVDASAFVRLQIEAICIKLGIPLRVFLGSERGELASSQDDAAWNDRLKFRQINYVTPYIIVPVVNRLILLGVLPKPIGFSVQWPDLTSQNALEKAQVAKFTTEAMVAYTNSGLALQMTFFDYLVEILGKSEDLATKIVENAEAEGLADMLDEKRDAEIKAMEQKSNPPFDKSQSKGNQPPAKQKDK